MGSLGTGTIELTPILAAKARHAAELDRSISEMVDDAVRATVAEDGNDITALRLRRHEPTVISGSLVKNSKRRGRR